MTGASGAIYTQRLLDNLHGHEIHFISTKHAREVAQLDSQPFITFDDHHYKYIHLC